MKRKKEKEEFWLRMSFNTVHITPTNEKKSKTQIFCEIFFLERFEKEKIATTKKSGEKQRSPEKPPKSDLQKVTFTNHQW